MSASGANSYLALIKADVGNPSATPPTPLLQKVNFKTSDMGTQIDTSESENLTGNRRTSDVSITGFTVGGGYDFEMTFENSLLDELMAAFLWGTWQDDTPQAGTSQLKDGAVYQPFYFERGHDDIGEYFFFKGMSANVMTMEFADQATVSGSYQFVGLETETSQAITPDATYTPATKNPVFSAVTNIPEILIDGVPATACLVKEWDVEINNNVTPKTGVGKLGACGTNAHKLQISGNLTIYFTDTTFYDKLVTGTEFAFGWTMTDNDGNSYKFTLPRCKLSADDIPIDGPDDIFDNAAFIALDDETTGSMIIVERTPI